VRCVVTALDAVASQVTIGSHTLTFDQPTNVPGGAERGPSPLDVMVGAVGACAHYFAAAFLQARKLPVAGLTVKETLPFPRLANLQISVELPRGTPERYIAAIERAVNSCPACGTLRHPTETQLTIHTPAVEA
jgi:putative redox protein